MDELQETGGFGYENAAGDFGTFIVSVNGIKEKHETSVLFRSCNTAWQKRSKQTVRQYISFMHCKCVKNTVTAIYCTFFILTSSNRITVMRNCCSFIPKNG